MSPIHSSKFPEVRRGRFALATAIAVGCLAFAGTAHADRAPNPMPGQTEAPTTSVGLGYWKLTLPVTKDGTVSGPGNAVEITALEGIAVPPYFNVTENSVSFRAPTDGATTKGSHYPRSELREMDGEGDEYDWILSEGGHLSATLQVDEIPKTKDGKPGAIVIGQIHGPDDELCRLYYENGLVYFVDDKAGKGLKETKFILKSAAGKSSKIPLGKQFSYEIDATSERLAVSVKYGDVTYTGTDPISSFWAGKALYFKAGVYVQVAKPGSKAGHIGTGAGAVTFFDISQPSHTIVHPKPVDEDQATADATTASSSSAVQ